ncbi:hypothetical protein STEG23_027237 [Scotinomys teguina]
MDDQKTAMGSYRCILDLLSPPDGEHFMHLARDTAEHSYEANGSSSAINIIEAFSRYKGLVSKEDVSIVAELYISNKQCDKALEVFHSNISSSQKSKVMQDWKVQTVPWSLDLRDVHQIQDNFGGYRITSDDNGKRKSVKTLSSFLQDIN